MWAKQSKLPLVFLVIFLVEIILINQLMRHWQPIKVHAVTTPTCLQSYIGNETKIFSSKENFVTFFDCMLDNSDRQQYNTKISTLSRCADLSFGSNRLLSSYLDLYEMTNNEKYLKKFTEIMDKLINLTDQKQHLTIYSGESLPAWSCGSYFTLSYPKILYDQNNQPSLEIRSENWAHNEDIRIEVQDGTNPNSFKITVINQYPVATNFNKVFTADNLTMNNFNNTTDKVFNLVKFRKLGQLRPKNIVVQKLETKRFIYPHNSGDIAGLLARYAYLSPKMSTTYKSKAAVYKQTAIDAVYVHDTLGEWIDKGNYGYYIWNSKGAFWADGHVQPYNFMAALGTAFSYLYRSSEGVEKERYRIRLEKLAKGFMYCEPNFPTPTAKPYPTPTVKPAPFYPCMTHVANGDKYVWPYGYLDGYYKYNMTVEPIWYGPLDLDFIYLLTEDGFLSSQDSSRFANTVYGMVKNGNQTPPALSRDVSGMGLYTTEDSLSHVLAAPWGLAPYAHYRRDIFDKITALFAGLPLNKFYGRMSQDSAYYASISQTAITADKNGYWSGGSSPTHIPTLTPTSNPVATATPTPVLHPSTTATPTNRPTNSPTPSTQPSSTPTPTVIPGQPTSTITPTPLATSTPVPTATPVPGECNKSTDLNHDGQTDLSDASDVIAALGQSGENLPEDLNCDRSVDLTDFLMVVDRLGT